VLVQKSTACTVLDDKPWLVADTQPDSPFFGRIYQFWTELLATSGGRVQGVPQVVRWSDDQGRHWSGTHLVTPADENTDNSQPVVEPDGAVVDTYVFAGTLRAGAAGQHAIFRGQGATVPPAAGSGMRLVARSSADGGATWSARTLIAPSIGAGPAGIRCCLPMVAGNPATGHLFAVWNATGPGALDPVELSSSADGRHWSHPVQVTAGHSPHLQYINAAVAASSGRVYVSFGARNIATAGGNIVQQELTWSANGGTTFASPVALGPPSDLKYAAVSGGKFPGDYAGLSATAARVTAAWCVSAKPPNQAAAYHQTLYAAVLRP
jgi:hypothetical protein